MAEARSLRRVGFFASLVFSTAILSTEHKGRISPKRPTPSGWWRLGRSPSAFKVHHDRLSKVRKEKDRSAFLFLAWRWDTRLEA